MLINYPDEESDAMLLDFLREVLVCTRHQVETVPAGAQYEQKVRDASISLPQLATYAFVFCHRAHLIDYVDESYWDQGRLFALPRLVKLVAPHFHFFMSSEGEHRVAMREGYLTRLMPTRDRFMFRWKLLQFAKLLRT